MHRTDRETRAAQGLNHAAAPHARGFAPARPVRAGAVLLLALGSLLISAVATSAAGTLPDGRGWELVSPPEKDGASVTPLGFGIFGPLGGLVQASEDGSAVTYVADAPVEAEPEGNRAIEGTQVISHRSSTAWSSKDIVTAHNKGEGIIAGTGQEYRAFSNDLSLAVLVPFGFQNPMMEPPLVPGASSEERGIYRRHNTTCQATPATCFEPLVTPENETGTEGGIKVPFGGKLQYVSASADGEHVIFKAEVKLTPAAPAEGGLYEWNAGAPAATQLRYVSLLPPPPLKPEVKGKPAPEAQLGYDSLLKLGFENSRNAISENGRRVFWSNFFEGRETPDKLYMRDTQKQVTIHLNASQTGKEPPTARHEVRYQGASADGRFVFFLDNAPLTSDSKLKTVEGGPTDLYVCEIVEVGEGAPECKLKDLTASFTGPGEVAGEILGTSADGTTVYFVANGAPASGTVGKCEIPGGNEEVAGATCNLYRDHYDAESKTWEEPKLLAVLSQEDRPVWGGGQAGRQLWNLTSRVSPNGQYLAFMSDRPLTGYDNRDANPEAHEARDEEVFLYNASGEHVSCVSCNPNRTQRPTGVFDQLHAGEGLNLRVDPVAAWENRWLAGSIPGWTPLDAELASYQSRYLLDNGRVFFNSADALVAQDTNHRTETIAGNPTEVGVEDVYQYEHGGTGGCVGPEPCVSLLSSGASPNESAFMDASVSGNDAFFFTDQQLVSSDTDGNFDIYDAHVCSEGSPCIVPPPPPPKECAEEATCRGGATPPPGFGSTSSETFSGPPSVAKSETLPFKTQVAPKKALTNAQKLSRALTACRKTYKHSKHKRTLCEQRARKTYGVKHKAGKK